MNASRRQVHRRFRRSISLLLVFLVVLSLWFVSGVWPGQLISMTEPIGVAAASADPVIAAAGDIACDPLNTLFNNGNGSSANCRQKYTSNLLVNKGLSAVLALGDVQYYCGSLAAFQQSYDLSWGRIKSITHPSVGNHEYITNGGSNTTGCDITNSQAAGYFDYYGSAAGTPGQGWYSFDIGTWHLIALNSNCGDAGGCSSGTPQNDWLRSDLAAHKDQCILAYWHIPLFSSGGRAAANSQSFWNLLYDAHADVILNGHDHIYERFAPQDPSGVADPVNGIREFIVGTGGSDHTTISLIAPNSEVINSTTYGVLELTLHWNSYDWEFIPEAGKIFSDSGSGVCHASPPEPTRTLTFTPKDTSTPRPTKTPTPTMTPVPTIFYLYLPLIY